MLDPAYSGVVVSTSSRFYTVVQDSDTADGQDGSVRIRVRSPQFVNAIWTYEVVLGESGVKVEPVSDK